MPIPPNEYRLAPEWRRCRFYLLFSCPTLLVAFLSTQLFFRHLDLSRTIAGCVFCILPAIPFSSLFFWKLRIDETGIWRRSWFFWDCWTWEDVESGRLQKRGFGLYDPSRPFWRRSFSFSFLSDADCDEFLKLVNQRYRLPPGSELPASLNIRYGFRKKAKLDANGLHVIERGVAYEYLWNEVQEVFIVRLDPLRRDCVMLDVVLPNRVMECNFRQHTYQSEKICEGASSETVAEFLCRHVPKDRFDIAIYDEPISNRRVLEKRMTFYRKKHRIEAITINLLSLMLAGSLAWIEKDLVKTLVMTSLSLIMIIPLVVMFNRTARQELAKLQKELDSVT